MNWGVKIIVGLGSFMIFIICATIYMVTSDSDSLIEDDYYEKSLTYDDVYERKQNLQDDHAKPKIIVNNDTLYIKFIREHINGTILLKRPSNGRLDKEKSLQTNTGTYKLPIKGFQKGNWLLEVNWESEGKKYGLTQSVYF